MSEPDSPRSVETPEPAEREGTYPLRLDVSYQMSSVPQPRNSRAEPDLNDERK